jgi:hypothetical protein
MPIPSEPDEPDTQKKRRTGNKLTEDRRGICGSQPESHRPSEEAEGDPAVPSLVSKLRERYEETKGRPDLTLLQYLADRGGYEGHDVDCAVSEMSIMSSLM